MFIKPCYKKSNGKKLAYWALVESYRTANGPRQRVVAYLGQLKESHRQGVKQAAEGKNPSQGKNSPQGQREFEGQGQSQPGRPQFVQARLFGDGVLDNDFDSNGLEACSNTSA